jgi:Protein of unknown function (DUF2009)
MVTSCHSNRFESTRLVLVQDYRAGQALVKNRNFKHNEAFFQDVFEIGRRYKIMNPDRMRATYGKLLYMLMDSSEAQIEDLLDFKCIKCALASAFASFVRLVEFLRDTQIM